MTIADFARLPRHAGDDEFWIVALLALPLGGAAAPLVMTRDHGLDLGPAAPSRREALDALIPTLVRFATSPAVRHRPAVIATDAADVEQHLRAALAAAAPDTEVLLAATLPPLDAAREDLAQKLAGWADEDIPDDPGPFAGPGVTLDRLRSFAQAARDFYQAAPWQHLDGDDLLQVDSPKAPGGQKFAVVMGSGGETFGLAFYRSRKRYELSMTGGPPAGQFAQSSDPLFAVVFHAAEEIFVAERVLWEENQLPLANPNAYPAAIFFDPATGTQRRADARLLAHAEAMLRALAATTEDEMDTGRWTKAVQTFDGPVEYTLSLPLLLADLKPKKKPRAPKISSDRPDAARRLVERAMARLADTEDVPRGEEGLALAKRQAADLIDAATQARGRRRVQLARQALNLDPDAADAWNLLAGLAGDPNRRARLYQNGVDAGRRALGDQFDQLAGHFWGFLETRPYMRARVGLAMALRDAGDFPAALDHLREMLRLNPNDNQGVRDLIPGLLLEMGRDRETIEHLDRWAPGDAIFAYARALALYRLEGDSAAARTARANALAANPHAARHLVQGTYPEPEQDYGWSPGQPSEAAYVIDELALAWQATPDALRWLATAVPPAHARHPRRRRR
jgi:tetratricopeptide (TPR) repeat protein